MNHTAELDIHLLESLSGYDSNGIHLGLQGTSSANESVTLQLQQAVKQIRSICSTIAVCAGSIVESDPLHNPPDGGLLSLCDSLKSRCQDLQTTKSLLNNIDGDAPILQPQPNTNHVSTMTLEMTDTIGLLDTFAQTNPEGIIVPEYWNQIQHPENLSTFASSRDIAPWNSYDVVNGIHPTTAVVPPEAITINSLHMHQHNSPMHDHHTVHSKLKDPYHTSCRGQETVSNMSETFNGTLNAMADVNQTTGTNNIGAQAKDAIKKRLPESCPFLGCIHVQKGAFKNPSRLKEHIQSHINYLRDPQGPARRYTCKCKKKDCNAKENRFRDIVSKISMRHCPHECEFRSRDPKEKRGQVCDHVKHYLHEEEFPHKWDLLRTVQEYGDAVLNPADKRIPRSVISQDVLDRRELNKSARSSSQNLLHQDDALGEEISDRRAPEDFRSITEHGFRSHDFAPLPAGPNPTIVSSSGASVHSQSQGNTTVLGVNTCNTDSGAIKRQRHKKDEEYYMLWSLKDVPSPEVTVIEELPRQLGLGEESYLRPALSRSSSKRYR